MPSESSIQRTVMKKLKDCGWIVCKIHGGMFQAGLPDLYCFHKTYGHKWIEMKVPGGRLTPAQQYRFAEWTRAGLPIWILDSTDLEPLWREPNVKDWL